jgi:hypothetical protein
LESNKGWARIEIYHKHELKRGIELVFDESNLGIQILSYAQLLQAIFLQWSII